MFLHNLFVSLFLCHISYSDKKAYGQSKLANILHANELARRLQVYSYFSAIYVFYHWYTCFWSSMMIPFLIHFIFFLLSVLNIIYHVYLESGWGSKYYCQHSASRVDNDKSLQTFCYFNEYDPKTQNTQNYLSNAIHSQRLQHSSHMEPFIRGINFL